MQNAINKRSLRFSFYGFMLASTEAANNHPGKHPPTQMAFFAFVGQGNARRVAEPLETVEGKALSQCLHQKGW